MALKRTEKQWKGKAKLSPAMAWLCAEIKEMQSIGRAAALQCAVLIRRKENSMKRLTDRSKEIPLPLKENAAFWARVHEKLARYEDSGLDPEEIHELLHDTTGPLHKKLAEWIDAEKQGRLVALPEPTPDIDFMRIFNLVMADADGRVIVLPCKVGDAIFLVERGNVLKEKVLGFIEAGHGLIMNVTYRDYVARPKCESIGKLLDDEHLSVFLTREEADAALKGEHK